MDNLLAFSFPNLDQGSGALSKLEELERDDLLTLLDAVAASQGRDGHIHSIRLNKSRVDADATEGKRRSHVMFQPVFGAVTGAALGAAARAPSTASLQDGFVRNVAETLRNGHAILCVQVSDLDQARTLERLRGMGGELIHSNLAPQRDAEWKEVLRGRHPQPADDQHAQPVHN